MDDDDDDDIIDEPLDPNEGEIVDWSGARFEFEVIVDEPTWELVEQLAEKDGVSTREAVRLAIHAHAKTRAVAPSPQS